MIPMLKNKYDFPLNLVSYIHSRMPKRYVSEYGLNLLL